MARYFKVSRPVRTQPALRPACSGLPGPTAPAATAGRCWRQPHNVHTSNTATAAARQPWRQVTQQPACSSAHPVLLCDAVQHQVEAVEPSELVVRVVVQQQVVVADPGRQDAAAGGGGNAQTHVPAVGRGCPGRSPGTRPLGTALPQHPAAHILHTHLASRTEQDSCSSSYCRWAGSAGEAEAGSVSWEGGAASIWPRFTPGAPSCRLGCLPPAPGLPGEGGGPAPYTVRPDGLICLCGARPRSGREALRCRWTPWPPRRAARGLSAAVPHSGEDSSRPRGWGALARRSGGQSGPGGHAGAPTTHHWLADALGVLFRRRGAAGLAPRRLHPCSSPSHAVAALRPNPSGIGAAGKRGRSRGGRFARPEGQEFRCPGHVCAWAGPLSLLCPCRHLHSL